MYAYVYYEHACGTKRLMYVYTSERKIKSEVGMAIKFSCIITISITPSPITIPICDMLYENQECYSKIQNGVFPITQ